MAIYISDSNGILKKVAGAGGGSGGESIIVDSVLNSESSNPVQNKVITKALNDYYTKNEVNKLIDDIPETDLSNYYNKGEVDNKIDNIPETDLSEYYTKSETDDKINNNVNVNFAESERLKSETDGAIVHEGDITNVEVVYDSASADSNINKGYTSGIQGGNSVNMDFTPYKQLRIYTHFSTSNAFGVLDFTRTVDTYSGEYPYISNITASSSNDLKEIAFMLCLINTAKSKILINEAGVTNGTNLIDKKNNNSYVVYKIEGVY